MKTDTLSQRIEAVIELLKDSYAFLFRAASKSGHWNEIRCTALAAMCLELREDGSSRWLNAIKTWMESEQSTEVCGSWGEEIWDSAMCIIALKDLGVTSNDPIVDKGLTWIASLFSVNGRNNWHDEPWETSWALIAFLKAGRIPENVDAAAAMKWLSSLQDKSGKIIAPHYTAYFLLINHFSERKINLSDEIRKELEDTAQKCQNYLVKSLRESDPNHLWTGEAWANGQILWSLCLPDRFPVADDKLILKTISWFEENQKTDGNWSDIEDTASAILGLAALSKNLLKYEAKQLKIHRDINREFENRLRKAVPVPFLNIKKRFFEREKETGYFVINVKESTAKYLGGTVGVLGVVASMIQIYLYLRPKIEAGWQTVRSLF